MVFNVSYWMKVGKRLFEILLILTGIFLLFKLSIFYMPFLIAFIISLIIEPLIKYIMKKMNFTRRTSSIIIFVIVSIIIMSSISWICITLFSETTELLKSLNGDIEKAKIIIEGIKEKLGINKIELSKEIKEMMDDFINENFSKGFLYIRNILNNIVSTISKIPNILICVGITMISLYFMCVDKIYILDQVEYHLPKIWVKKLRIHLKDIIGILGKYLKAEITLIFISFIICLTGLYLLKIMGFNIDYPLLIALVIGFVDALPILRIRNYYDTLGNNRGYKRGFEIRQCNNYFVNYHEYY